MWDAVRFCKDFSLPFWLSGKNVRPGQVAIRCPLCPDHSNHGSLNPETGGYQCWRCGNHSTVWVIRRLLGISGMDAEKVWAEYDGGISSQRGALNNRPKAQGLAIKLPGDVMAQHHRDYLTSRGFDAEYLEKKYGLLGTGPACRWEGSDFRLRVIIPIYDDRGVLVNFQGRDITGRSELRYKGCPVEKAIKHHKDLVYGAHLATGRRVIAVEGVFDQWRLGDGFVATFGTSITQAQIATLANWEEIFFLYDPEPEAQAKARGYCQALAALGRRVELIAADFGDGRDPGDLSETEAAEVRRELLS